MEPQKSNNSNLKEIAINAVLAAFSDTVIPSGPLYDSSSCEDPEWGKICGRFESKCWTEFDLPFLMHNYEALYVFTPGAFQYYLPAFLLRTLEDYDTSGYLIETLLFALTPEKEKEVYKGWRALLHPFQNPSGNEEERKEFHVRMQGFNRVQCKAICAALQYFAFGEPKELDAQEALENYWEQRCKDENLN